MSPRWTYRLTRTEARLIELVAALRHTENLGRPNRYGLLGDGRDQEALGCYGEYCAAALLNLFWKPVAGNPWHECPVDIGNPAGRLQVRTSLTGHLYLHPADKPTDLFVAVRRDTAYTYTIAGWLRAEQGQQPSLWREPQPGRPCYAVPYRALNPADTLPR